MAIVLEKRPGRRRSAPPKKAANSVPRSPAERLWLVGGGTVALLLTVVAYFFFISPQRAETSDVRAQVADARGHNAVLQHKLDQLREENRNLAKYQAELQAARRALPASSGVSDFLRSLQSLGAQTQTDVTSLSVGPPTDVSAQSGVARPAGGAAAPTPAAGAPAGSAAGGVDGGTGGAAAHHPAGAALFSLSISAQVTGSPAALIHFLDQLQNVQPRAVLITAITQATGAAGTGASGGGAGRAGSGGTTLQLTMLAFVAPVEKPARPGGR